MLSKFIGITLFISVLTGWVTAQQPQIPPAVVAYACAFERAANRVDVRSVMQGADARPLADRPLDVRVEQRGQPGAVETEQVQFRALSQRPPLRLVLVLDLTDTVPLTEITAALEQNLLAELLPEDEIALITFSEDISPVTPFVKDKTAFINDYLTGLTVQGGDNRMFDAIGQALDSFPFSADTRQAVLVVTDSGRRQLEQMPTQTLITEAQRTKTQVYTVAFVSRDQPDIEDLALLAESTGGYAWYYGETNNTRASIGSAVSAYLTNFVRALNSETVVSVSAQGLQPDSNKRAALDLTVTLDDSTALTDTVTCPVEVLEHSIGFITNPGGAPVTGRIDIGVNAQSDLGSDQTRVVFRVNDEVVQTSNAVVYTFDAAALQPGLYTIEAELWDRANNTLARTASALRLYVQQQLQLTVDTELTPVDGALTGTLRGAVELIVLGSEAVALPDVVFTASPAGSPEQAQVLGTAPYVDGEAALHIEDIPEALRVAFPEAADGGAYQITASVPSVTAGDPVLAQSNPLPLTLPAAPTPTEQRTVQPVVPERDPQLDYLIPISLMAGGLALNILLLRAIRRRKIRRLIDYPDNSDLGPQLMNLTVLHDGVRHSHPLTKKTVTIGRGSSNDVNISDDANVSRQHGVVMWRKGAWHYSNRKGNAVTRIDGKKCRGLFLHRLDGVTELQIGDVILIYHSSAQQDIADFIKTDL